MGCPTAAAVGGARCWPQQAACKGLNTVCGAACCSVWEVATVERTRDADGRNIDTISGRMARYLGQVAVTLEVLRSCPLVTPPRNSRRSFPELHITLLGALVVVGQVRSPAWAGGVLTAP